MTDSLDGPASLDGRAPHLVVISRFRGHPDLADALRILAERPGCRAVELGQSTDDAALQVVVSTWDSVGDYRRALSSFEVKMHAVPLLSSAIDEPSAFEIVLSLGAEGTGEAASGLAGEQS